MASVLTHEFFLNKELYFLAQYAQVTEEGPSDIIFGNEVNDMANGEGGRSWGGWWNQEDEVQVEVPAIIFCQNIQTEYSELVSSDQDGIIDVDYDN